MLDALFILQYLESPHAVELDEHQVAEWVRGSGGDESYFESCCELS